MAHSGNRRILLGAVAGAIGGLAASYVMNLFQTLLAKAADQLSPPTKGDQQSGGEGDDATVKTASAISRQVFHHELTEPEKKWAGPAVHYAFGTLAGAAYGVLAETVPHSTAGYGTAYGSALWLAADEVAVPGFGISKPPSESPLSSHAKALASHLVYGFTTDLARRAALKA